MLKYLFQEYTSFSQRIQSEHVILLHLIGGLLIGISFVILGFIFIFTGNPEQRSKRRVLIGKMFGLFLITCGISRIMDVVAIWHNYAVFTGYMKILTGLLASVTLFMIPAAMREIRGAASLDEVKSKMKETEDKIDKMKEISDKLNPE